MVKDLVFFVYIRNSSTTKLGKAISLKFHIAQHSRDTELLFTKILLLSLIAVELN